MTAMHESPRLRRLRNDLAALERLRDESTVLRFRASGRPAQQYTIEFKGKGLARVRGRVTTVEHHQVEIKLGASYPRTMPEIRWLSPVYHPNISEIGMVCLGGYGTHWVPSLNLDELCGMLWDMARYHNYDVRSPYNREAALWVANQTAFRFPLDARPLRDLRAALGRVDHAPAAPLSSADDPGPSAVVGAPPAPGARAGRFASFIRSFSGESPAPPPPAPPAHEPARDEDDGLVVLDEFGRIENPVLPGSSSPRPEGPPPARLRAADEEIVFID